MAISHTLEEMIQKYTAKMNPTQVGNNYQNAKTVAINRYEEGEAPFMSLIPKIKNILESNGVSAGKQGQYFGFAFQLQKYALKHSLAELENINAGLQQKFTTEGCDPAILSQLANLITG